MHQFKKDTFKYNMKISWNLIYYPQGNNTKTFIVKKAISKHKAIAQTMTLKGKTLPFPHSVPTSSGPSINNSGRPKIQIVV